MMNSFAICQLPAICVPSGIASTPCHFWLFVRKADGSCRLRLPTCQLPKHEAIQGFEAVGKLAELPLLLRSKAAAAPLKAAAQLRPILQQRKENAHEQ